MFHKLSDRWINTSPALHDPITDAIALIAWASTGSLTLGGVSLTTIAGVGLAVPLSYTNSAR